MKIIISAVFAIIAALALSLAHLSAHHSHAMFDGSKEIEITGVITSLRYANPHVYMQVRATHRDGMPLDLSMGVAAVGYAAERP